MKKYDKLNLTSEIYRDKNYGKINVPALKLLEVSEQDNSKKKYLNICCPNCKYLFKIPKEMVEEEISKTPTRNKINKWSNMREESHRNQRSARDGLKSDRQKEIQVQTQQYLLGSIKSSPKKQGMTVEENYSRYIMTDRTPQRLKRQLISPFNNRNKPDIPLYSERKYQQSQKPQKLKTEKSASRKHEISRSNQRINDNLIIKSPQNILDNSKKFQFPVRSVYMGGYNETERKIQHSRIINEKISNLKAFQKQQKRPPPQQPSKLISETPKLQISPQIKDLRLQISKEMLQKIILTSQIGQIIQYQMNLPPEMNVPSYCKMLAYQLRERREIEKKKSLQLTKKAKNLKDKDNGQEDLPQFLVKMRNEEVY